ncbi:DUF5018-related domain-containing protein [Niabella drilacis]|uniref:DUF5018 domain-containing protein n=1 Tax=Niabella drilacis (strain DSM 25811 / CCM 8410 / CCUG 62505 / LMG 26954 / E90) TaxID=1285928 RepID=A0A1G6R1E1_NIADE|nr:hypothetical protein [Niabella drilacis]SDC98321.1 hypothetical protein SAMN04487894_105104 [Niabella drilacis]
MKKVVYLIWISCIAMGASSCLKAGLDKDLPKFKDAMMTDVFMEYLYESPGSGGSPVVRAVSMSLSGKQFKKKEDSGAASDSAIFIVTVPAASGSFTTEERAKVTTANLSFMCNISTAATMVPVDGAPKPGVPGDFSQARRYRITAADGSSREWVVRIVNFIK